MLCSVLFHALTVTWPHRERYLNVCYVSDLSADHVDYDYKANLLPDGSLDLYKLSNVLGLNYISVCGCDIVVDILKSSPPKQSCRSSRTVTSLFLDCQTKSLGADYECYLAERSTGEPGWFYIEITGEFTFVLDESLSFTSWRRYRYRTTSSTSWPHAIVHQEMLQFFLWMHELEGDSG